jgi:hypothetical protein
MLISGKSVLRRGKRGWPGGQVTARDQRWPGRADPLGADLVGSDLLDIRAEAAFYNRFLELTAGVTTLIISHRFATVRRADRFAAAGPAPGGSGRG